MMSALPQEVEPMQPVAPRTRVRVERGAVIDNEEIERRRTLNSFFDKMVVANRNELENEHTKLQEELENLSAQLQELTDFENNVPDGIAAPLGLQDTKTSIRATMEKIAIVEAEIKKRDEKK